VRMSVFGNTNFSIAPLYLQVSVHPKRKRAEFLENSDKGETAKGTTVSNYQSEDCSTHLNCSNTVGI
jgi:hypothetical protein